ncbi:hypothetical protein H0H81_001180 [Sphagnurus paluster]|uniref:Uncharacterized protein n=1 Tax=Sphagnurus paluster TaxID=117069 RepID=A0A9P7KLU4_9AGAR|nr:hypothetical protein H0H81_001180 [Sphagnurus paluster]
MSEISDTFVSAELAPDQVVNGAASDVDDEDSDAFNTEDARIHFGPLRSPEKKFGEVVARCGNLHPDMWGSPLRRSPRLSTPQLRSLSPLIHEQDTGMKQILEHMNTVDIPESGRDTPDDERLQDEPSLALAIRITQAHDNPSPPPSPPKILPLIDLTSPSPRAPPRDFHSVLFSSFDTVESEASTPPASSNVSPGLSRDRSPAPQTTSHTKGRDSAPDLISFESFSTPAAVFRVVSPMASTSKLPPTNENSSVDDLLAQTPQLVVQSSKFVDLIDEPPHLTPVESLVARDRKGKASATTEASQDVSEESVVNSLLLPDSEGSDGPASSSSDNLVVTQEALISPLRRSKRTSGTPHQLAEPDQKALGMVRGDESNTKQKSVFRRELRSLSPSSTDLLSSLVASPSRQPHSFSFNIPIADCTNPESEHLLRRPFPILPQGTSPQTPQRSKGPIRFASPSRSVAQKSTVARLQPMALDDPNRTPARRVLITEASHVSPLKGSRLVSSSRSGLETTSYHPHLTIPPADSPARRVEVSEANPPLVQKKWQGVRFGSPARGTINEQQESTEFPSSAAHAKACAPSKDSSTSFLARGPATAIASKSGTLPFPIIASEPLNSTTVDKLDANNGMASPTKRNQPDISSPAKSNLKQPTSRIPRTVAKPYTRPGPKPSEKPRSTGAIRKIQLTTEVTKFSEAVPGSANSMGSDDTRPREALKPFMVPSTTLKRKRVITENSPTKPRPVVVIRQVPRPNPVASSSKVAPPPPTTVQTKKVPQQIRRVVDKAPATSATQTPMPVESSRSQGDVDTSHEHVPEDSAMDTSISLPVDDVESSSPISQGDIPAPQPQPYEGVRRTGRIRKSPNPSTTADVFSGLEMRTLPPRRKASQTTVRQDALFSGMSATALKALTTSNTVRNQQYVAAKLETEVIRKEGMRPESPVIKIRTISQRQQDEKGKQRKERAERRARRDGSSDYSEVERSDGGGSETESESDDEGSPAAKRHKRGPGDECDYQTPVRKLKRLRLGDDDMDATENGRRVKWDRGLFTTIYLDQVKVGARQPSKDKPIVKGCLAPTAKALPLDSLGNLPHANLPLTELVEESVLVKKFVYDNDIEPVEEVVVKKLRSRKVKR